VASRLFKTVRFHVAGFWCAGTGRSRTSLIGQLESFKSDAKVSQKQSAALSMKLRRKAYYAWASFVDEVIQ